MDPKIKEAKKMLLEAVKEQQNRIHGIVPPKPELKEQYEKDLEVFSNDRGINLWYPFLGSGFGKGPFIELLDGSVKYDFIVGIGVHQYGYNHPEIMSATIDAAISNGVMQGQLQQNGDTLQLMELLIKESNLDHCYITTSGAMANEQAFKLAFQKNYPAYRILSLEGSFAGRTMMLSDASDKPNNRQGLPEMAQVDFVPFYDYKNPEGSIKKAVEVLKKHISRHPKKHALMVFELIQGEGGCYAGSREYFTSLMTILKENGIAVIIDEIQSFGRTSRLFAFQHFGLEEFADIVTIGKMTQVCAFLYKNEWKPRPGLIGQTFTSSTAAIKAGKTIVEMMFRDGFFGPDGKNMTVNRQFSKNFEDIAQRNPGTITGPYGLGGMIAFTPFDGNMEKTKEFNLALFHEGVIGFIAGASPTRTRFLPPIGVITPEDIDIVCKIIEKTIRSKCK